MSPLSAEGAISGRSDGRLKILDGSLQSATRCSLQCQLGYIEVSDGAGIFAAGSCQRLQGLQGFQGQTLTISDAFQIPLI